MTAGKAQVENASRLRWKGALTASPCPDLEPWCPAQLASRVHRPRGLCATQDREAVLELPSSERFPSQDARQISGPAIAYFIYYLLCSLAWSVICLACLFVLLCHIRKMSACQTVITPSYYYHFYYYHLITFLTVWQISSIASNNLI